MLLDLLLLLWVAAWVVLAVWIYSDLKQINELSNTVIEAGQALEQTADTVDRLGAIPFVGEEITSASAQIREAGRSAVVNGRETREAVSELAILLAIAVGVIPSIPLIGLYLPLRVARVREIRALRRACRAHGDERVFQEFLARRATQRVPYHRLRAVSENPWADINEGRFEHLAALELERVGLRRRRRR